MINFRRLIYGIKVKVFDEQIKQHSYAYSLLSTVCLCVFITIFCILNGQHMAATHVEPPYSMAVLQIIVAVIIAVVFIIIKYTRNLKWFLIPATLIAFAPLYVIIVNQYPCCVGG